MWYFGSKCQRIGASVKASHKRLKAVLASGVRNFGLFFVALKLVEFLLFDNFFLDLAKFQDLDIFSLFDFPDLDNFSLFDFLDLDNFLVFNNFLHFSIDSSPFSMPSTSLAVSTLLATSTSNDTVVFSIDVSGAAILLKP